MTNYEKLLSGIKRIALSEYENVTNMADAIDFSQPTLSKILNKQVCPRLDTICKLMDKLQIEFVFPDQNTFQQAYLTPEIAELDHYIATLRSNKAPEEAIKQFALAFLKTKFEKNTSTDTNFTN